MGDELVLHIEGFLGLLAGLVEFGILVLKQLDALAMNKHGHGQSQNYYTYYNIKDDVLKSGVLFLKHLLLELHALVVHLNVAAVNNIAVGYKHYGVVNLLELSHILEGLGIVAHAVIDNGHTLGTALGGKVFTEAQSLIVVLIENVVINLDNGLDGADAVALLELHKRIVDAIVEFLVVLIECELAYAEECPTLVDGRHIRLSQNLVGIH